MKKIQDNVWLSAIVIIVLLLLIIFLPNIVKLFSNSGDVNSNLNQDKIAIIKAELNKIKNDTIYRVDEKILTSNDINRKIYMISEEENKEIYKILKYDEWTLAGDEIQLPLYEGYEINYESNYYIALNIYDEDKCTVMFATDKEILCTYFAPISIYNECGTYIDSLTALQGSVNDEVSFFYDVFAKDSGLIILLDNETDGISDDEMSAYSISKLQPFNMEQGNSIEEYNVITKKYFNKEITNFENSKTTVDKETGMIKATGWSYDASAHMVLKSTANMNSSAEQTADFDCYVIQDSDMLDGKYKHVKEYLTTGNVDGFPDPIKIKLTFNLMKDSEKGSYYILYRNMDFIK